jgi:nucleoside-diphosphate-sugar epimerase
VADYKSGQVVTEEGSLERFPLRRGAYSASKQDAERMVIDSMTGNSHPVVILRPGTIYGPGGDLFTPMMGFSLFNKVFVVIGNGRFELPFAYVDNVVEAVLQSMKSEKADNQVFNVVDSDRINKKQYMQLLMKKLYPKSWTFYLPFFLLYLMTWAQEVLCRLIKRDPFLTRYRLISSQKRIRYDNAKIIGVLDSKPRVPLDEALRRIIVSNRKTGTSLD